MWFILFLNVDFLSGVAIRRIACVGNIIFFKMWFIESIRPGWRKKNFFIEKEHKKRFKRLKHVLKHVFFQNLFLVKKH